MRQVLEPAYRSAFGDLLLIHTPKCGGTYLRKKWNVGKRWDIRDVGHDTIRNAGIFANTRVVGLIREPLDWYQSYFYFRRSSLSKRAQSVDNFPPEHPISTFLENRDGSFETMIGNMSSPDFLGLIDFDATVYARSFPDLFPFLRRTRTGLWTWTMMHHFSMRPTTELRVRQDVIAASEELTCHVRFIRQESIDRDATEALGPCNRQRDRENASPRPDGNKATAETVQLVQDLDGAAARIIGGYEIGSLETAVPGQTMGQRHTATADLPVAPPLR